MIWRQHGSSNRSVVASELIAVAGRSQTYFLDHALLRPLAGAQLNRRQPRACGLGASLAQRTPQGEPRALAGKEFVTPATTAIPAVEGAVPSVLASIFPREVMPTVIQYRSPE